MVITVIGSLLIVAGIAAQVLRWRLAVMIAWAGLLVLHAGGSINLTSNALTFWAIAALLATGIDILLAQPKPQPQGSDYGPVYMLLGAYAGLLVGISIDAWLMTLSAIVGTVLGAVFYMATPSGRWLRFSFSHFYNYLCGVGLKIMVLAAITGLAIEGLIVNYTTYI